jgi:hypothetical protein
MEWQGLDCSCSGERAVEGSCEYGYESSASIEYSKITEQLQILKKCSEEPGKS